MYAIISDRSKQATVHVGDELVCDLMDAAPGSEVVFDRVLAVGDEGEVRLGKPVVEGVRVLGQVVGESKGDKLVVLRFKRRKNVRRKTGHRQHYTRVKITAIEG